MKRKQHSLKICVLIANLIPHIIIKNLIIFFLSYWKLLSAQIIKFQNQYDLIINQFLNTNSMDPCNPNVSKDLGLESFNPESTNIEINSSSTDMSENDLPPPIFDDEQEICENYDKDTRFSPASVDANEIFEMLNIIDRHLEDQESTEDIQPTPIGLIDHNTKPDVIKIIYQNFVKSEKLYYTVIYCLNMFNNAIINLTTSDQNISVANENKKLFGKIPELVKFHTSWIEILESHENSEDELETIISFFVAIRNQFLIYKAHALNGQTMLEIWQKFCTLRDVSEILPRIIDTPEIKLNFEEALSRPTTRLTDYFAVLDDLRKNVPKTYPKYKLLEEISCEFSLLFEVIKVNHRRDKKSLTRYVDKWSPLVEDCGGESRKHRLLILTTDYLICAGEGPKDLYSTKWHCSVKKIKLLEDLEDPKLKGPEFLPTPKVYIDDLKDEINKITEEIAALDQRKSSKKLEKMKRLLSERVLKFILNAQMSHLVLQSSAHPLYLYLENGKRLTLLFLTDGNLKSWQNLIRIRKNSPLIDDVPIYMGEVTEIVECVAKKLKESANNLESSQKGVINAQLSSYSTYSGLSTTLRRFSGRLYIRVRTHRYDPILTDDIVVNIELDKQIKNFKTNAKNSKLGISQPDIFYLEMMNSLGYLYVTLARSRNKPTDHIGSFVLNLTAEEIVKKPYCRKKKTYKWGEIVIFLEFNSSCSECKHIQNFNPLNPSLTKICESEGEEVPLIVSLSMKYIEREGIDMMGIYRVSGTASKTAQMYQLWGEGFIMSIEDLNSIDVTIVTGNLKQFFRELQEPVIQINDLPKLLTFDYQTGSREPFLAVLDDLPIANKKVFIMILDHLLVIEKYKEENKMSFQNLAMVFGVNVIRASQSNKSDYEGFNFDMQ
ncbi:hypothetical protein HZS_7237, partial [Henneguya salminicola]